MFKVAGLLFFLAGASVVMGIITAEIFYPPGYSISLNMISNLGSTPPPQGVVHEPSARIFDTSLFLAGLLVITGSLLVRKRLGSKILESAITLMGIGVLGVGIFPAYHPVAHPISALITFLIGGVAAVLSFKVTPPPINYLSFSLGSISLIFLFLGLMLPHTIVPLLGDGGTERWIAYPCLLWLMVFGGYLMGNPRIKNN